MKNQLDSLCWNITEKCNENCKFCYRRKCRDNTLEENLKIIDNLSKIPIGKISFCGGEPLLYEDLFTLVKYIRKKNPNIKLSITTNGTCINDQIFEKIKNNFDIISLSIDSVDRKRNEEIGRGENHLDKVIQILEKWNQDHSKIKIKINTVVTKINKEELESIYRLISNYPISRWKIFRFFPIRGAKEYKEMFYLEKEEALKVQELVQKLNKKSDFSIEYNDFEGKPSCFSIQPNGTLENSENEVIGNFLEDSIEQIMERKRLEIESFEITGVNS